MHRTFASPSRTVRRLSSLALSASLALAGATASAAILTNGSFEGNTNTAGYGAGSTGITGWVVRGSASNPSADIQWNTNHDTSGITTPFGNGYLDLTGTRDGAPYATILQGFATTVGQAYAVTFWLGYDNDNANYRGPASAMVDVNGTAARTFTTTAVGTGAQWQRFEYDFVAVATASVLEFQGVLTGGPFFIGLDNVSVDAIVPGAVPEPASVALLAGGLLAGVVASRRRTTRR